MKKMLTLFLAVVFLCSCQSDQNTVQYEDTVTPEELIAIIQKKDYSLVYFWTTWCAPCRKTLSLTLPVLEKSLNPLKAQLLVVAVSKDENKIKDIVGRSGLHAQKFRLEFVGPDIFLTHKLVLKNTLEGLFPNYEVWNNSVPVFVLVDKNLNVIARKIPSEHSEAISLLTTMTKKQEVGLLVNVSE